jgi:competence protein ComGC
MMHSLKLVQGRGESGFTLIDMLFVIALVGLLSTLAIPGLMRAKGAAQSASALGSLRVINSAQLSYAITCGLGFYAPNLTTLGVRPPSAPDAFLPPEMSSGATFIKSGYTFSMAGVGLPGAPGSCNGLAPGSASAGYAVVADPLVTTPPARFFGTNADGVIYEHTASYMATMTETGSPGIGAPIK